MDEQFLERRKRQLMILNGIRDPEVLDEMMNEMGETVAEKSEVTTGRR